MTGIKLPKDSGEVVAVKRSVVEVVRKPFDDKHAQLGGAPGQAVTTGLPEDSGHGRRVRYQDGTIYLRPDGGLAWVHGAIGERYDQLGAGESWLGLPLSDESPMSEDGRANLFEHGVIYWWPDVGAIELGDVVVHYTGLYCIEETDWDQSSNSDEPYAVFATVTPSGTSVSRTRVYDDRPEDDGVDSGDSRPDLLELYRGRPEGIVLRTDLFEHDFGDPDKYKDAVAAALTGVAGAVATGLGAIPIVGPFLGPAAGLFLAEVVPEVASFVNDLLDTGDDGLGWAVIHLTAKQMVVFAARTENSTFEGIGFKFQTGDLTSGEGARYRVYFGLVPA